MDVQLVVTCPHCDAKYRVDPRQAALRALQRIRCQACQRMFSLEEAIPQEEPGMPETDSLDDVTMFDSGGGAPFEGEDLGIPELDLEQTTEEQVKPEKEPREEVPLGPDTAVLLEVMRGRNRGLQLRIHADKTFIGRVGTDVLLTDSKISRRHAAVLYDGTSVVLRDLESTNGTYLNGKKVVEQQLHDGDAIAMGNTLLHVHFEPV